METDRRTFVRTGAAGLAAAVAGSCGGSGSGVPGGGAPPAGKAGTGAAAGGTGALAAPFKFTMQFFGMIVHGAWYAANQTDARPWDVLALRETLHRPQLRLLKDDVVSQTGGETDRSDPRLLWWSLLDKDVVITVDSVAGGNVKPVLDARVDPVCPKTPAEFRDMTWIPSLTDLLQKIESTARLDPALKNAAATLTPGSAKIASRVRLTTGGIECARPTLADVEKEKRTFSTAPYPGFVEQFYTDLVRFTADVTTSLVLELIPFGGSTGDKIVIAPKVASTPVFAAFDHIDPTGGVNAMTTFCKGHFLPYYGLYKITSTKPRPCPDLKACCDGSCDPPYYCVPARGDFPS